MQEDSRSDLDDRLIRLKLSSPCSRLVHRNWFNRDLVFESLRQFPFCKLHSRNVHDMLPISPNTHTITQTHTHEDSDERPYRRGAKLAHTCLNMSESFYNHFESGLNMIETNTSKRESRLPSPSPCSGFCAVSKWACQQRPHFQQFGRQKVISTKRFWYV